MRSWSWRRWRSSSLFVGDLLREALAEAVLVVGEQASCGGRCRGARASPSSARRRCPRPRAAARAGAAELAAEHGGDLDHALRRAAPSRSSRAAITSCTVPGMRISAIGRVRRHFAVAADDVALLDERARDLLGEERAALGLRDERALELGGQRAAGDGADDRARPRRRRGGRSDELCERRAASASAARSSGRWRDEDHHPRAPEPRDRELEQLARGSSIQCRSSMTITTGARWLARRTSRTTASNVSRLTRRPERPRSASRRDAEEPAEQRIERSSGSRSIVADLVAGSLSQRVVDASPVRDAEELPQHGDERRSTAPPG